MDNYILIIPVILFVVAVYLFIQSISLGLKIKRLKKETDILKRLTSLPDEQLKDVHSKNNIEIVPYLINNYSFSYDDAVTAGTLIQEVKETVKEQLEQVSFEGWTGATICHSCGKKINWHSEGFMADLGARVFCNDDCYEEWNRERLMKAEEKHG